jgi:hypothetical protein
MTGKAAVGSHAIPRPFTPVIANDRRERSNPRAYSPCHCERPQGVKQSPRSLVGDGFGLRPRHDRLSGGLLAIFDPIHEQ